MKQNITIEQLNELSDKGKEGIYEWCKKNNYFKRIEVRQILDFTMTFEELPLLSIGQMIEFIGDGKNGDPWFQRIRPQQEYPVEGINYFPWNEKLCDALWEAVKQILERE